MVAVIDDGSVLTWGNQTKTSANMSKQLGQSVGVKSDYGFCNSSETCRVFSDPHPLPVDGISDHKVSHPTLDIYCQ